MGNFYTDIETTGFNPEKDKIISIQYQQLNSYGQPISELVILKEWKSSEEEIIKQFHKVFMSENVWDFIPIGTNLIFDLTFLFSKFKKYNLKCPDLSSFLYTKPIIDIKYMLIMANHLSFKGSGLDQFTNKKTDGREIPQFYTGKHYKAIEDYIKDETIAFIEFFSYCLNKLPGFFEMSEELDDSDGMVFKDD